MNLKPQDLVVALKVFTRNQGKWNQRELAHSLEMSLSEVNGSLKRAIQAGLMLGGSAKKDPPQSLPDALQEFIQHGVRYSFPVEKGAMARGVPTGIIGAKLENEFLNSEDRENPVWPSPHGKARGIGIRPLYKSIPGVAVKKENRDLYSLLSLVDMIRAGGAREREIACGIISKKMGTPANNV